jgi:hypothetical protein
MFAQSNAGASGLSLDEYIRRKNIVGNVFFRKKEVIVDKDDLDESLDQIARQNAILNGKKPSEPLAAKGGRDKFARYECLSSDEENEDGDGDTIMRPQNSSIEFAKKVQSMEHPECCNISKKFLTIESKMKVKTPSQQHRIKTNKTPYMRLSNNESVNNNNDMRINKLQNGRVQKNRNQKNAINTGTFVEKGSFTYKFGVNNDDDVLGIVRNQPMRKVITGQNRQNRQNQNYRQAIMPSIPSIASAPAPSPPVNINMNWNGFFKGVADCLQQMASVTQQVTSKKSSRAGSVNYNDSDDSFHGDSSPDNINLRISAEQMKKLLEAKCLNESDGLQIKQEMVSNAGSPPRNKNPFNYSCMDLDDDDDLNCFEQRPAKPTTVPLNLQFLPKY